MNSQSNLRTIVRGAYDVQKLRIQMSNRIVGNWKAKLGQPPGKKEEVLDEWAKKLLADLRVRYRKLSDAVGEFPKMEDDFEGDEVISTYTEMCLVAHFVSLEEAEKRHFKRLGVIIKSYPLYTEYLEKIRGIGPAMSGVLISEIDIHKDRHPSSLWKFAGLDVADDGLRRSRRKEHLITVKYTNKKGEEDERQSITFNPFLKTKLMGVLGPSLLRVGRDDNPYAAVYDNYKHRMESHATYGAHNDKKKDAAGKIITSKGRRHNQALGVMVKHFLVDLYVAWRTMEGLEVSVPYNEAKLGHVHGGKDEG